MKDTEKTKEELEEMRRLVAEFQDRRRSDHEKVIQDLVRSKRSEEVLLASEGQLQNIIDNVLAAISVKDLDGHYNQVNPLFEAYFGIAKEDIIGKTDFEFLPKEIAERYRKEDLEVLETGISQHREEKLLWEGEYRYFTLSKFSVQDRNGVPVGIGIFSIENTKQRQAEEAFKESREYLLNLVDTVADIIFTVKMPERRIEYVNQRMEDILGYLPEEVIGQTTRMFYPDEHSYVGFGQKLQAALKNNQVQVNMEQLLKRKNNELIWVDITTTFMFSGNELTKVISLVRDITDRKRMEDEFRKTQNLESLGLLAGGIAHDLDNVLTGVLGSFSLLDMLLDKGTKAHQIAKEGLVAANRTRDLTQQLLTFAKGGAPIKEVASIQALIRETTDLLLHGSNTKPEYHLAEDLQAVHIDLGQIGQVVQNLVLNADQAMPEGGTLSIFAENIELSDQNPLPIAGGEYVKVTVGDQGVGMSDKIMAKIFDPYYTTKPTGHGLGLSITHSIIHRHDGYITVHSEKNVGTTFEFYLPALQEQATKTTEKDQELARGTGRILLMDDEVMIHATVGKMLKMLGYEVQSAHNGEEAVQKYQAALDEAEAYDLVILDLTIPGGMGGQEAVGKLLEIDPRACIIVSSGYANDPVMTRFTEYGFVGTVKKPVDLQELAETVKRVLADRE
ncbi:MAG: PAS domain S-box protein [Candidatus Latescibacteria bacterium]|nr:PAS domain S-box protein [Candidatus Latescibacterota bacterium]